MIPVIWFLGCTKPEATTFATNVSFNVRFNFMGIPISDYNLMQARLSLAVKDTKFDVPISRDEQREQALHNEILDYCRAKGWLANHGSTAHRTHRTPGEPDFVILMDGGRLLLVECKTKDGKISMEQLSYHAQAKRLGHTVHVIRSFEDFLKLL